METKQVIIIRKDLNMRKGKMVAQGAHASLGAVFSQSWTDTTDPFVGHHKIDIKVIPMEEHLKDWFNNKFTKIAVSCDTLDEMMALMDKAESAGLLHFICRDAGITEFKGVPTYTALAIGPGPVDVINKITGHLKLL